MQLYGARNGTLFAIRVGTMSYCAKCGTPLPPGAQFCPKCGTPLNVAPAAPSPAPVSAPSPAPAPAPARTPFPWWIIPLVLLVLGGLAWLLLAGLPFGGGDRRPEPEPPRVETIAEGTVAPSSPRETGTIMDVAGERPEPEPARKPEPEPAREPARKPAPEPERPSSMLNDEQASATLREYVTSRNYYKVEDDCVRVESRGLRNRGFDYEVWHSCERGGGSRLLGRWRVDALTREVFRQQGDGRYLRP